MSTVQEDKNKWVAKELIKLQSDRRQEFREIHPEYEYYTDDQIDMMDPVSESDIKYLQDLYVQNFELHIEDLKREIKNLEEEIKSDEELERDTLNYQKKMELRRDILNETIQKSRLEDELRYSLELFAELTNEPEEGIIR